MKYNYKKIKLVVSFLLMTLVSSAQKFALIDRDLKRPILFTDSVTANQVIQNYFPINVQNFDSLFANFNYIKNQLNNIQRSKFKSFKLRSGSTFIQVNSVAHAYGDAYDILLVTTANNVNAEYLISSNSGLNKKAIKNLNAFIEFIKKEKALVVREFKEYQAIPVEVTVYMPYK